MVGIVIGSTRTIVARTVVVAVAVGAAEGNLVRSAATAATAAGAVGWHLVFEL
jgi:hypothetical protein